MERAPLGRRLQRSKKSLVAASDASRLANSSQWATSRRHSPGFTDLRARSTVAF